MADRDYTIVGPGGREITITGPDNASPDQLRAAAEKAFGAPSISGQIKQQVGNLAAGAVRGAGSIGATLLTPYDLIAGNTKSIGNPERRAAMDDALGMMGAETNSLAYRGGKLAGEVAGTAGVGGAAANAIARVPGVAPAVLSAARTSGMVGGSPLVRAIGGATSGALSAGLVNPENAAAGAVIGGVLPGAMQVAGAAGKAIGRTISGPEQPADLAKAVQAAREAGYVIPPTQARQSLANRIIEGFSGKITTAQNASAKNQAVTNAKAAVAIGLPPETKITPEVLDDVRRAAGQAYADVASLPARAAVAADTLTNTKASPAIKPDEMVFGLRKARNDATAWFRSYGRTADPDALVKAKSAQSTATELESALEDYAASQGRPDIVQAMRDARQVIAKTYSVEAAMNPATGSVDARKLAEQLAKGKPLSGDLKQAAEFAARFPKASQAVEGMGSLPQSSPLDWAVGGGLAAASSNPLMLASVMARPAARAMALSPVVQNRLVQQPSNALMLSNPAVNQLLYRTAPLIGGDR